MEIWSRLFDNTGFIPRALCGAWTPGLIRLHNVSDFLIWTAYLAIPVVLVFFAYRRRKELPFRQVFLLFGIFILACGTTHLMDIILFYNPLYYLSGAIKLVTAAASWGTVLALTTIVPRALAMRTPEALEAEIEERKRVEEELRRSEERFRSSFESASIGKALVALDGRWIEANEALCQLVGYSEAELRERTFQDITHPSDLEADLSQLQEMLNGTIRSYNIEKRYIHKDGREVWALLSRSAVRDAEETPLYFISEIQGIDERKKAEDLQKQINDDLERRVQERTEELSHAKEEAERANLAKSEFLSRTSHELRTPMNAALGFAQILKMTELTEEQNESVEHILGSGRHLLKIIDELLDIARIEQDQQSLSVEPVSVYDVVQEVLPLIQPLASENEIRLENDADRCRDHYVMADQQRLKQVFLNLLSNAVKYNRERGSVVLSCEPTTNNRLRISVRDTGQGIAPEYLDQLFIPFNRLGAERTDIKGTGLGLTLAKSLTEAMNGTLTIRSEVGKGSTFSVELPLTQAPAHTETVPSHPPDEKVTLTGTVLYIEDNTSNYSLVAAVLRYRFPEIELLSALKGADGLKLAVTQKPDLILLDLHLPDMTGDEVLLQLQANSATQHLPVVILSADAVPAHIKRLRAAGAKSYLTKPLHVKELLTVLQENLGVKV
jgi:PAS domain S-box-containing protein